MARISAPTENLGDNFPIQSKTFKMFLSLPNATLEMRAVLNVTANFPKIKKKFYLKHSEL